MQVEKIWRILSSKMALYTTISHRSFQHARNTFVRQRRLVISRNSVTEVTKTIFILQTHHNFLSNGLNHQIICHGRSYLL